MHYLDDLKCETEEDEYKIFVFNQYNMGIIDGFKMLKSGNWTLNELVKSTLKAYIQNYIPKYIATFSHPRTTVKMGKFYIGVDDDGLVHGIPFIGELNEELVRKQIHKLIPRLRGANDYDCLDKYLEKIKIEVIKLDKTNFLPKALEYNLTSDFGIKTFERLKQNKKIEDYKYKDYIMKKRRFEKFINSFPQKINNIINDKKIRKQLIELIKKKSTSTTKLNPKYKNIYGWCDVKNDYWNMITELKSDKLYEPVTFEIAEKIRNEPLSPIFWGLVWRDLKTIPCKILKPQIYRYKYNYKQYSILMLSQVPKMIPSWLTYNPDLNIYIIKITFSGNISSELFLEYQDSSNMWVQSFRTTIDNEPRCQPVY
jgi:hypothetical protein